MIRINEFMERKGIRNQTELARMLGLTQSAISSWNSGARAPTHEMCETLLRMGMTFRELFGDEFPDITFEQLKKLASVSYTPPERTASGGRSPEQELDEKVKDSVIRLFANLNANK